jgi:hypothetical protein
MTTPKLSFSTIVIGRLGGHSANRVSWITKKKAAAKHIDPDAAFKKVKGELGTEFDSLRDIVEAAKKHVKAFGPLDAAGKQRVEGQADKCKQLIRAYQKVCVAAQQDPKLSPAKSPAKGEAWKELHEGLHILSTEVDNKAREVVR